MEYNTIFFGDVAKIKNGYAFKSKEFQEKGIPVIKIKNIISPIVDTKDSQKVSIKTYEKTKGFSLKKNDILISLTGSGVNQMSSAVGKVGRIEFDYPALQNQRVGKFELKYSNSADLDFLFYYFLQPKITEYLVRNSTGSANQANINSKLIETVKIPNFSLIKQKSISKFLNQITRKIETNQKMIANLEELSQTLFKRWFVDFEFPDENGNPYKSSGGEMVDSELGKIPKYWKVSNLDKIASFVSRGITPKYNENSDIQIPIINQKVNKGPRLDLQYIKYFDGQNRIKKELYAQKNDLLLNSLGQGTLGRIHLFTRKSEEFLIDQHISIIRFDNINYSYFYYAHINTDLIQGQIDSLISGSTGMLMLNITKIRNLKVILPTEELVLKYSKLVNEY
ncbi:MAG: restriction endonuclease subunit S, partial [Peptostreptococcus sp.]